MYTDQQLEEMLGDLESLSVERKGSMGGETSHQIREAVCQFANDLADTRRPGAVIVGAKDDGSPSGLAITDQLLLDLAAIKTDGNIVPPPSIIVEKRVLRGAPMAVVSVEPADALPVRYKGRIHVRFGPRRGVATAQDERILSEKRRHRDRPFDMQPVQGARLSDLNVRFFEESYLPSAVAPDVLAANERTGPERLAACKMIVAPSEPIPTVVGILTLGHAVSDFLPGAYIQFLRISGTTLADPVVDEDAIHGTVSEVLRRVEDKFKAHNKVAVDFTSGTTETRRSDYPLPALQQLVRNAVLHRAYEATNAPTRVTWYDDRIEIGSPGGLFGSVTRETFGRPGVTDYRNPSLAEALRVLGFVQRFGAGIATARTALQQSGHPPPEFEHPQNFFQVTVRKRP